VFHRLVSRSTAIGEVGLDYSHRSAVPRVKQRRLLADVLAAPGVRDRVITLHSASSIPDVLSALAEHQPPAAILHWFLGSTSQVEEAINLDLYFSVNEAMLSTKEGQNRVVGFPPNRVLLETDAPYGGARKRELLPGDLRPALRKLATLWDRDEASAEQLVKANQESLLQRATVQPSGFRSSF